MNFYFSKRESAWPFLTAVQRASNKNYPYQLCVNFCILTSACIFGNYSYQRGAILLKPSGNKHYWRSNWLNHFSYIYFVSISSWCNFVFRLLSFNEGALTRDMFDEIPWSTKPSSLLLFCLSSLLNPALTEGRKGKKNRKKQENRLWHGLWFSDLKPFQIIWNLSQHGSRHRPDQWLGACECLLYLLSKTDNMVRGDKAVAEPRDWSAETCCL